ncbi:MAG TPA: chemotaxis protein CheA [Terriglobales bacterium]|nr:chemotaxis protein CheA [Terriglobales bacterium]
MTQFSDERGAELRELFFETSQELLQSLNEEALKLEKQPGDLETVRSIRRIVHTLKGDAAACGFRELSNAAHELEDALALESACTHSSLAEVAFTAADTFGDMLAAYRRKSRAPSGERLRKIVRALAQAPQSRKSSKKKAQAATGAVAWTEYEQLATQNAAKSGKSVYHLTAIVDSQCAMPIAARQLALNALKGAGEVLAARPEPNATGPLRQLDFLIGSLKSAEELIAVCRIPTIITQASVELMQSAAERLDATPQKPESSSREPSAQDLSAANTKLESPISSSEDNEGQSKFHLAENILRVDAERIDNVLNLVGELIIGKSMLQQAFNEFAKHFPKEAMRGRFSDAMAFQSRVLSDLQRSVMKIRMVPVEQLFRRFPRMVRDVAKQCGKEVELAISGQDTDLDKSLLDAIAEPITHLVRNAISHGIETAEERTRKGKPAHGTLRLSSYHHGNQVIVEVSDDGRGIDAQKIKAKALQQGMVSSEEAGRLSENEILEFVFRPGFSTAEEVTEISGRGVGLDVVQAVLHRLKGTVEIATRPGKGTTFRLKLPLTLAIIKALLFRVEQRLYAIPLNAVAEITRAQESDLHKVDSSEVLQLRNQVLPVVRLGRRRAEQSGHAEKIFVLVIALGERKLGLIVDALEGEEELVIKALDDHTVSTDLVSGASILGDGRVVLIVNLPAIVERHSKHRPTETGDLLAGILLAHSDHAAAHEGAGEVKQ